MVTKTCTKCNQTKELTEFSKQKLGKYGVYSRCKFCVKQYQADNAEKISEYRKQYLQDNAKHIAARSKQYKQTNAESIAKQTKQWQADNAEKIAELRKQYNQDNATRISERGKKYKQTNKEHIALCQKQYHQTPKGKAVKKANHQNRRAHKLNNGGKHTGAQILALFEQQSGKCPYCKVKLFKTGSNKYHCDHIVPLSKGGSNNISNIQLLCPKCNLTKNDKLPEEFAQKFGRLL